MAGLVGVADGIKCNIDTQGIRLKEQENILAEFKVSYSYGNKNKIM